MRREGLTTNINILILIQRNIQTNDINKNFQIDFIAKRFL